MTAADSGPDFVSFFGFTVATEEALLAVDTEEELAPPKPKNGLGGIDMTEEEVSALTTDE